MISRFLLAILLSLFVSVGSATSCLAVEEEIKIVLGKNASELEHYAADQLRKMLGRLTDDTPKCTFLIGNPSTNSNISKDAWPKISDQGIVLKSIDFDGKPALILGGGSPAATLWSVYDFGYRHGIRYTMRSDIYPDKVTQLKINDLNLILEPNLRQRIWSSHNNSAVDLSAWPLEEYKKLLKQLAKKKFNHLQLSINPGQPFILDSAQQTISLWQDGQYPIPRDAPGRTAFGNAKLFENPDLAGISTSEDLVQAGQKLLRGIITEAHHHGISVSLVISPLSSEKTIDQNLALKRNRSCFNAFPNLDQLLINLPNHNQETKQLWKAIQQQADFDKSKVTFLFETTNDLHLSDSTPSNVLAIKTRSPSELTTSRSRDNLGILSQSSIRSLEPFVNQLRQLKAIGFSVRYPTITECDPSIHFLARAAWDDSVTARSAHDDLFTTITGSQSVSDRLWLAFGHIEKATQLIESNDLNFVAPATDMLMKHYQTDPEPDWWTDLNEQYTQAMIELYRSHDAAAPRSRRLLFYWAKRSEFVLEYLSCLKSLHAAGNANKTDDSEIAIEQIDMAVEQLYNALDTLSDVVRDQSDRGLIAVLNAYAYRPLMVEYEKLLSEE